MEIINDVGESDDDIYMESGMSSDSTSPISSQSDHYGPLPSDPDPYDIDPGFHFDDCLDSATYQSGSMKYIGSQNRESLAKNSNTPCSWVLENMDMFVDATGVRKIYIYT